MNFSPFRTAKQGAEFNVHYKIPRRNFRENDTVPENMFEMDEPRRVNHQYNDFEPNSPRYASRGPPRPFGHPNNFPRHQQFHQNNFGNEQAFPPQPFLPNRPFGHGQPLLSSGPYFPHQQFKRPREMPKIGGNASAVKFEDRFRLSDPTLPKELTALFQPLYCKLCVAQLSSSVMARLHYSSKNHDKKVRKYLVEYSEKTGEPLHERAKVSLTKKQKLEDDQDPKNFHCDVCDLPLTGRLHAESHYMGKNHQRAVAGKPPSGKGHYDNQGNWVRTQPLIPADRDNFGVDFVPKDAASANDARPKSLRCELCKVSVTSEQQMTMHISGQKHKKRVEQQASEKEEGAKTQVNPDDTILSSLSCNNIASTDLSVYRTPSGYYYCSPCNLTLNSETQFKQHLGSKKHRKKASASKE